MKECRYTRCLCEHPHLLCKACPNHRANSELKDLFVPASRFPRLPDPTPFVKVGGNPSGAPGTSITIGLKGTF